MADFPKSERLCSRKSIESLFQGGNGTRSMTIFPIRMVYGQRPDADGHQVLMSVSKRHFKHAVQRNRVKRQLREAWRHHKNLLDGATTPFHIAFIWLADELFPSKDVDQRLSRMLERLSHTHSLS